MCPVSKLTVSAGAPVDKSEANNSLNDISLINNEYFMDTMSHFVRERIPERIVHTKGTGAYGYFEVTRNISYICKAKLFGSVGKKTRVAVRFSAAGNEKGLSDTIRGTRGLAIKFYTEDGNLDLITINQPMFNFKEPFLFVPHAENRNPKTNLYNANSVWDLTLLNPEILFASLYLFGDRGIPYSYRHTPLYSVHTYEVVNKNKESFFVRFHFIPDQGIKNLSTEEAESIGKIDRDAFTRDLYNSIENGDYPSWTVSLQILSQDDVKNAAFDVFDVTRILPEDIYPLVEVGRLVLDKNVLNFFAEVENMAFCPSNLVPGIPGPTDTVFESRRLAYRNAHIFRIGPNFNKLPINRPITKVSTYLRDGQGAGTNERDHPNYRPNSFCGPMPNNNTEPKSLITTEKKPYNFDQVTDFINNMSEEEQNRLVKNAAYSLEQTACFLQEKAIRLITKIHSGIGKKLAKALNINKTK